MVKIEDKTSYLKECIITMSKKVIQMYELAFEAIEENNKEKALQVIQADEFVNLAEEDINDIAIESLALLSPVAKDLRLVVAGIKIASDLERIGDYAKGVAAYVIKNGQLDPELVEKSRQIGDIFLVMLDHAIDAYDKNDANAAMEIPQEDDRIDTIFNQTLTLIEQKAVKGENVSKLVPSVQMMRNLERAGDHTKNICEDIIYQVKGQHIEFN